MGSQHFHNTRSIKLLFLFFIVLILAMGFLSSIFYTLKTDRKLPPHTAVVYDRALRGAIFSKDGYIISRSNKRYTATINSKSIDSSKKELFIKLFSIYSGISIQKIQAAFLDRNGNPKKGFITLSKKINATTAIQLKYLAYQLRRLNVFRSFTNSHGVQILYGLDILENGEEREFQLKDTLTPAIGYVRRDNVGRYKKVYGVKGLEKYYEKYLNKSQDGMVRGKRDVIGTIIRTKSSIHIPRQDGYSLHLNILMNLQKYVEATLDKMKRDTHAKEIIAGVMKSKTGEIIALASSNRYDPTHITKKDISKLNDKFTEYPYEPGSVIKPITLAIALDSGKVTPKTIFNTHNGGPFNIGKRQRIHDDTPYKSLSATDIIVHSSNIGISQIAWLLSGKEFYEGLKSFGFSQKSGIDLSRELVGKIKPIKLLSRKSHSANQAYGYGMEATFIQLLKAHNVFNNNGVMVTPHLIDYLENSKGEHFKLKSKTFPSKRIISSKTAKQMHKILQKVVLEGTAKATIYPGLDVGGKTGTAHIAQNGGYSQRYNSSFFGFVNDNKGNKYEIGVLAIEPSVNMNKYFASKSSVPTFKAIIDDLVDLGYLYLKLTPEQKAQKIALEKKRRETQRKIQQERTRKIKEILRRQREKIHQKELEEKKINDSYNLNNKSNSSLDNIDKNNSSSSSTPKTPKEVAPDVFDTSPPDVF